MLTGRSGSGKSTFARSLAGLLDYRGRAVIRCGLERVAYLGQDVEIFDAGLDFNVALEASLDRVKVKECLARAGIGGEEFAALDSRSLGESGRNISVGQKLRIGIARMLYHEANVMIFDEPTASLDRENAIAILDTIRRLESHTRLVITHDPAMAAAADLHLVCASGQIRAVSMRARRKGHAGMVISA